MDHHCNIVASHHFDLTDTVCIHVEFGIKYRLGIYVLCRPTGMYLFLITGGWRFMKKLNTRSAASHNHCNGPYSLRRPVSWQSYIQLADLQGQHAWRLNDLTNLQATLHKMTIELVVGHTLLNTSI